MSDLPASPRIIHFSWGCIHVDNGTATFKDAKVFPGGAREWDWGETGTGHIPGIQPADVEELIEKGARVIVLSQGMWGRLGICRETLDLLEDKRIAVHVLPTDEAVILYNELTETDAVGGLFHTTC